MQKPKTLIYRLVMALCYGFVLLIIGGIGYFILGLFVNKQPSDPPSTSKDHLFQLGLAIQQYGQDNDGSLPNMALQRTFQQEMSGYVKDDIVFKSEISGASLQPNYKLDGLKISALHKDTIVMFDPTDDINGEYSVLYGSWETGTPTKPELDAGLAKAPPPQ